MDSKQPFFRHCVVLFLGFVILFFPVRNALAFQVDPLPADNLIKNPWFRSSAKPTRVGMDFWTNVNNYWTLTQKINNPSPDAFLTGTCDKYTPTYCGTSAKLAADDGNAIVGVDAFLYQVVAADPTHKKLKFYIHWVAHYVDPFEVKIYGGETVDGPWNLAWTPLHQVEVSFLQPPPGYDQSWLWIEMTSRTPPVDTIISNGYPFYKVELRANLPSPEGFKLTGVYFATESTDEPVPGVSATPTQTPGMSPTPTSGGRPSPTPEITPTSPAGNTPTTTPVASPSPTSNPSPTSTPISGDLIFVDDFETGDLSGWSSSTVDGVDLSVSTEAALSGNYGMKVVIDDTIANYVTDGTPGGEPRYRARFYFDPNSITMADTNAHALFYGYSGTSVVIRVDLLYARGGYQLKAGIFNDSKSWKYSGSIAIDDNPHFIELDWKAATSAGTNDGNLVLWSDGLQKTNLTAVDNDTHRIDQVRLGAVAGIDSGTLGTYYIDAFESRRSSYIGPAFE
jgi:hypothetical protein